MESVKMTDDEELEKIKKEKMKDLMRKTESATKSSSEPITVTDATFKETIEKNPAVVIDCWAPWCGPCRMVSPIVDEMARDNSGRITFGKLNVDENPDVTCNYNIMSIPTLLVFKDGKLVDRIVGAMPRPMLEERINRCIC
jgi:thioredoxin 1